MVLAVATTPALDEFQWAAKQARAPRLRTMAEFAEQEVVLPPTGRWGSRRFRCDRQPFTRLWFAEIDSGRWARHWCTGISQGSKTTIGFNIPMLYHLFERRETVICGLPSMEMAFARWNNDIRPAIESCPQYRDFLPRRGAGSKGGVSARIKFGNGAVLQFMSAGGGDKSRASATTRVLLIDEADGFDEVGTTSRESDKIEQLEARLRGWDKDAVEYAECTLTTEEGRTFQEITNGSNSRIVLPCPHCGGWVIPEREHVQGWQDAEDEVTARDNAHFCCPDCGKPWTEDERFEANRRCKLVHRGQGIGPDGVIHGDPPRTFTLGFRWTAVHNMLRSAGMVGLDLWKARKATDEENAEKKICQFVFAVPYRPPDIEITPLKPEVVQKRVTDLPRGVVPDETEHFTVGVDMHKRVGYYVAVAWLARGRGHIADYGTWELQTDDQGIERGTLSGLRNLRDMAEKTGWGVAGGGNRVPDAVWIDAGWAPQMETIYAFCREAGERYRPLVGRGVMQQYGPAYARPKKTGAEVRYIGDGYHLSRQRKARLALVEINVDRWKTRAQEGLASPADAPGALTLFRAMPKEHWRFAQHMCSERLVEEFKSGVGPIKRWEAVSRNNHWLDALVYASAAGHFCGVRLIADPEVSPTPVTNWFANQKRRV